MKVGYLVKFKDTPRAKLATESFSLDKDAVYKVSKVYAEGEDVDKPYIDIKAIKGTKLTLRQRIKWSSGYFDIISAELEEITIDI